MTSLTTKLMIAAAALVAAGAASAQTMTADVPFAFQAGGKAMAAGTYLVDLRGPAGTVAIRDAHLHSVVLARPISGKVGAEETPKLVFACARGNCVLSQVWPGGSKNGRVFQTPKPVREEEASVTAVRLRPAVR
jgi:hypothetical protein